MRRRGSIEDVESWLTAYAEQQFGIDRSVFSRDLDLASVGIDSLEAITLVGDLERWLGDRLPPTLLWDCATIGEFLEAVAGENATPNDPLRITTVTTGSSHAFGRHVNPHLARRLEQLKIDRSFVRGEGVYLFDGEGRRYVDFIAQYGALPFGHNPPDIWDAVLAVRSRGEANFVQPALLDAAGELAARLIALAPGRLRYVTLTNSGAESIEAALKLCRNATGRPGVLSTELGFHGKTLAALSASGKADYQSPFGLPLVSFDKVPFGDIEALRRALETRPGFYSAFLIEPIQGEGGILEPPTGYLREAEAICRRAGVLVVVDEVQTGLGRTGAMFASSAAGLRPDVLTVAKALGGGLVPIGACLCTEEVYSEKFGLKHSSTFAGGALAARVGIAALDLLERDGGALIQRVAENGAYLKDRLQKIQKRFPDLIQEVRGRGYLLGIRLANLRESWPQSFLGVASEQGEIAAFVASYLLNVERVRLAPTLNRGDVLRVEPPLIATRAHCAEVAEAIERTFGVLASGDTGRFYGSILDRAPRPASSSFQPARPRPIQPAPEDARFAFLLHPLDAQGYADFDPGLNDLAPSELQNLVDSLEGIIDPFVGSSARIVSKSGASAFGEFIVVPYTTEGLLHLPPADAVERIGKALRLAARRGAQIVGLGAYTSIVTRGGLKLVDAGVPITTGNSYSVVAGFEALELALRRLGRSMHGSVAAVIGGAGSIGCGIATLLAEHVDRLILVGNPAREWSVARQRLLAAAAGICRQLCADARTGRRFESGSIAAHLLSLPSLPCPDAPIAAFQDVVEVLVRSDERIVLTSERAALGAADIVAIATSFPGPVVGAEDLKRRAVVCDISRPRCTPTSLVTSRPDVLVLDAGLVEIPGHANLGPYGIEPGHSYACMAETIMLALERRFESTSLGALLPLDAIYEQRRLARKHGFAVAELESFGRMLAPADWNRVLDANRS